MTMHTPIIDAHAALGDEHPYSLDAGELLRRMDAAGIALAIARPAGAELVVNNRAGNDRVLAGGARVRGLATANPWYGTHALDELRRAKDKGAVGLYLHPSRQGFQPIEPVLKPLMDLARSFAWPVMFHTGSYVQSDVLAVAELARRYPETIFVAGYAGFTDMWFELPDVIAATPNLCFDTGLIWSDAVAQIARTFGHDRILFSGGEPRNRYAVVLRAIERHQLADAVIRAILHDNAARIFRLSPIAPAKPAAPPLPGGVAGPVAAHTAGGGA